MDFNQQLSALNNKIQKLHERTKSKSVSEEVEEIVVMEKKSEQEVTAQGQTYTGVRLHDGHLARSRHGEV